MAGVPVESKGATGKHGNFEVLIGLSFLCAPGALGSHCRRGFRAGA